MRGVARAAAAAGSGPPRVAAVVQRAPMAALMAALVAAALAAAAAAFAAAPPAGAAAPRAAAPRAAAPRAAAPRATPFAAHVLTSSLPVRSAPTGKAREVALLRQFRRDFRPTVILAIGRRSVGGRVWYRIRLPGRPNGRTGWVDGERLQWLRDVGGDALDLDLSQRRLRVQRDGRTIRTFPVAVGKPSAPTPRGNFYLAAAWRPAEPLYGRWAIETSAGASITDWPGGGVIGIHGTNQPWLIGQAVSHGCIRMRNADILRLRRWAKPGTRLRIHT
jgi:lipoprotein-anchoring transpeptidase ErfK/SrfK